MRRTRERAYKSALEEDFRSIEAQPQGKYLHKKITITVRYIAIIILLIAKLVVHVVNAGEGGLAQVETPGRQLKPLIAPELSRPSSGFDSFLDSFKPATAAATDGKEDSAPGESSMASLEDRIRQAGEFLASRDVARAKEIVRQAMHDCESGQGNLRDCSQWSEFFAASIHSWPSRPSRELSRIL